MVRAALFLACLLVATAVATATGTKNEASGGNHPVDATDYPSFSADGTGGGSHEDHMNLRAHVEKFQGGKSPSLVSQIFARMAKHGGDSNAAIHVKTSKNDFQARSNNASRIAKDQIASHAELAVLPSDIQKSLGLNTYPSKPSLSTALRDIKRVSTDLDVIGNFISSVDGASIVPGLQQILNEVQEQVKDAKIATVDISSHIDAVLGDGSKNYSNKQSKTSRRNLFEDEAEEGRSKKHKNTAQQDIFADLKNMNELHAAIIKGDGSFVMQKLSPLHQKLKKNFSHHGRKLSLEDKKKQCKRLVECVSDMSFYDLFMFFYTDNISEDGEIGDEVVEVDGNSEGIFYKLGNIRTTLPLVQNFLDGGVEPESRCDELLQLFHRNIERPGILPEKWVPSNINDICRARGETRYVAFSEMTDPSDDDPPKDPKFPDEANYMFEDLVFCAKKIHDLRPISRPAGETEEWGPVWENEAFVFFTDDDADQIGSRLRFPLKVKPGRRDEHGEYKKIPSTKRIDVNELFDYNDLDFFDDYFLPVTIWSGFTVGGIDADSNFRKGFNKHYSDLYLAYIESVFVGAAGNITRTYPEAKIVCPVSFLFTSQCTIQVESVEIMGKTIDAYTYPISWEDLFGVQTTLSGCDPAASGTCTWTLFDVRSPLQNLDSSTKFDDIVELVFGSEESVGLICSYAREAGSRNATGGDPRILEGWCCLDGPYSQDDEYWGEDYTCDRTCQSIAPYFAGFSKESCDVFGGTFCENPQTCEKLKSCIEEAKNETITSNNDASTPNNTAYELFLEASPEITDPTDRTQCGVTKEYFGFDEDDPEYDKICEEIKQMKYRDDFTKLDDLIGASGGGGGTGVCSGNDSPGECAMDNSDTTYRNKWPNSRAQAWRGSNFALEQVFSFLTQLADNIGDAECPGDISGASQTICAIAKAFASAIARALLYAATIAMNISVFVYGEEVDWNEEVKNRVYDETLIVRKNMVTTYNKLDDIHQYLLEWLFKRPSPGDGSTKKFAGCNSFDENSDDTVDECGEDNYPPEIDITQVLASCGHDKFLFTSLKDGKECIEDHLIITDDCQNDLHSSVTSTTPPAGASQVVDACSTLEYFKITGNDGACGGNEANPTTVSIIWDPHAVMTSTVCDMPSHLGKAPTLDISRAVELCNGVFFRDIGSAKSCVKQHIKSEAVCREVSTTIAVAQASLPSGLSVCTETHNITITAHFGACTELRTEKSLQVLVDPNIREAAVASVPPPSCEFLQGPDVNPKLDISSAVDLCSRKFFKSISLAMECVELNTQASDVAGDCRPVNITYAKNQVAFPSALSVCTPTYNITVTARVEGECSNELVTEDSMLVLVDEDVPGPLCEFPKGPDLNPIIDTDLAVELCAGKYYNLIEEAYQCVLNYTKVHDDTGDNCRPVNTYINSTNDNCVYSIVVTAKVKDCEDHLISKSSPINVTIDNMAPIPDCSMMNEPKYGVVIETGPGVYADAKFSYNVQDNCPDALSVQVKVSSNELVASTKMATFYEKIAPNPTGNVIYGMYVSTSSCNTVNNGPVCIDPDNTKTNRYYKTEVTATDLTGNTASTECFLEIIPKSNKQGHTGPYKSTELFLLDKLSMGAYKPDPGNNSSVTLVAGVAGVQHTSKGRKNEIFNL